MKQNETPVPKIDFSEEDKELLRLVFEEDWFETPRPLEARIRDIAEKTGHSIGYVDTKLRSISRWLAQVYYTKMLYGEK